MNIIVPMAGKGQRFLDKDYKQPKPLIDVLGKTMIERTLQSLNIKGNYIFIVQKEHYTLQIPYILNNAVDKCKIIISDKLTQGQACSVLLAEEYINNDDELLIVNSDNYFIYDKKQFLDYLNYVRISNIDGLIFTFIDKQKRTHWSFAKVDNDNNVIKLEEKIPISDFALNGVFYFKKGADFVKYAKLMIEKDIKINNEFYVAPIFNEMILDRKIIKNYLIEDMISMGTPEELEEFKKWFLSSNYKLI